MKKIKLKGVIEMTKPTVNIDLFFAAALKLIETALNEPQIRLLLEAYGYNEPRLLEGKRLHQEAQALQDAQKKEYRDRAMATAEL
ncbi:MAG TPA: hypothetical protein VHY08_09635, partial [Bacillota bacterium]|nr:hypothetical protein [Bacillota bacterium]